MAREREDILKDLADGESPRLQPSSACEISINTPPQNIDALINAARKYGRFDR